MTDWTSALPFAVDGNTEAVKVGSGRSKSEAQGRGTRQSAGINEMPTLKEKEPRSAKAGRQVRAKLGLRAVSQGPGREYLVRQGGLLLSNSPMLGQECGQKVAGELKRFDSQRASVGTQLGVGSWHRNGV